MSTRCVIKFVDEYSVARIYRHSDGYPDSDVGVLADLERFFSDVEKDTKDTRFNDPSYLAAKFVVWQSHENAKVDAQTFVKNPKTGKIERKQGKVRRLAFLGVGVVDKNPGDIEYEYTVKTDQTAVFGGRRPAVTWREVPFGESDADYNAELRGETPEVEVLTSAQVVSVNGVKYQRMEVQ